MDRRILIGIVLVIIVVVGLYFAVYRKTDKAGTTSIVGGTSFDKVILNLDGNALDVENGIVKFTPLANKPTQSWTFTPSGNGHTIRNKSTNGYLTRSGNSVILTSTAPNTMSVWKIVSDGDSKLLLNTSSSDPLALTGSTVASLILVTVAKAPGATSDPYIYLHMP